MAFVAAVTNLLILHFRDDAGKHATMKMNVVNTDTDPGSGGPASISTAAQAISDSALYETELLIVALNNSTPSFGTSPYGRPADKAAYKFTGGDGTKVNFQIGAPLALNFSNAWNIAPLQTQVAAFIAAMIAHAKTEGGAAITAFAGGTRRRPPRLKKQ
jgi:hypothetical protein